MTWVTFGRYVCARCSKEYFVEDGTWRRCTPEFCHDCIEHLCKQYVLLNDEETPH
jgi:hypothetical protein